MLAVPAELPLIVRAEIVKSAEFDIAPPLLPASPPVSVRPLIDTVDPPTAPKILKSAAAVAVIDRRRRIIAQGVDFQERRTRASDGQMLPDLQITLGESDRGRPVAR